MQKIQKTISILFFSLLTTISIFAQADAVYTVRLGNFTEPQPADFADLKPVGFLFADSIAADLYLISLGMYSSEAAANVAEEKVKSKGFPDANVEQFRLKKRGDEYVIQMATLNAKKTVKWKEIYAAHPNISVNLVDDRLIIFATGFKDRSAANAALRGIQKAGFSGAFPKTFPSGKLFKITEFEAGGVKKPTPPALPSEAETLVKKTVEAPPVVEAEPKPEPKTEPKPTPKKPAIKSEIVKPVVPKPGVAPKTARRFSYPEIDGKIKRNSAIELQRVLKSEKVYSSNLDGFYGPGTTKGFDNFRAKNRQWKKYVLLSDLWESESGATQTSNLQQAIFDVFETPSKSNKVLEKSADPLALAYRAFLEFRASGPSKSVNDKMNLAIERSFPSKKLGNRKPFDYTATYAYQDYEQLLLHLKYLHLASEEDLAVPCWIFDAFSKESEKVFGKVSGNLKLKDCTGVTDWEEIRVLQTLASDISPNANQAKIAAANAKKAQLLLSPTNLPKTAQLDLVKWNSTLMGNLSGWATRDPMHKNLATTFKVAFYQSQVRLESYFINNGIRPDMARFTALATLQALVGEQMGRFTD